MIFLEFPDMVGTTNGKSGFYLNPGFVFPGIDRMLFI